MKKYTGLLAVALLTAFSGTTFANTNDDGSLIKSAGFCYMYATRLTEVSDSGLQIRGINLFSRFNGQVFKVLLNNMDKNYGKPWVNSTFQKGNMEAMELSASDLIYNQKYSQDCNKLADSVESSHEN